MTVHGSSRTDLVTYEDEDSFSFFLINLRDNIMKQTVVAHTVKDVTGYFLSGRSLTFHLEKMKSNLSRKLDILENISAEIKGASHLQPSQNKMFISQITAPPLR